MKKFIYSYISNKFMSNCSHYNSLGVRKLCRTKEQARQIFSALDIPHAKGTIFFLPFKAFKFARTHGFPLVVKPNVSGYSRGAHFPITNFYELFIACIKVKIWWPTSIVEQYLWGNNYRVVVVKNKVMSLIRRYPPFVDGDGSHTINELIDLENEIRTQLQLYPVLKYVSKAQAVINYLHKQRLNLTSVPTKGQRVYLHNKVALKLGGVVEILDKETITPANASMIQLLIKELNANILGIDVICESSIATDFTKQKSFFLEINSRPYLEMHHHPRYGEAENLEDYYNQLNQLEIAEKDTF